MKEQIFPAFISDIIDRKVKFDKKFRAGRIGFLNIVKKCAKNNYKFSIILCNLFLSA